MSRTEATRVPWLFAEVDGGRLRVFYATSPEVELSRVEVSPGGQGGTRVGLVLSIPVEDDGSPATVTAAEEWRCVSVAADLDASTLLEDAATGEPASSKDLGAVLGSDAKRKLAQLRLRCADVS